MHQYEYIDIATGIPFAFDVCIINPLIQAARMTLQSYADVFRLNSEIIRHSDARGTAQWGPLDNSPENESPVPPPPCSFI